MKNVKASPRNMNGDLVAAIASERARISSIIEAPQAQGREKTAIRLALHSDMAAADALDLLATTPKDESPFVAYMNQVGQSGVPLQAGAPEMDKRQARMAQIAEASAHTNAVRGYKRAR